MSAPPEAGCGRPDHGATEVRRVLVVDDSRATRAIIRRILERLGFEVHEAADGGEGIAQARALEGLGLMLVDWNMPVADGLEVVRAVRRRPELAAVRILMVTTESEVSRMVEALEAGADEYLMKPFSSEALCEKLSLMDGPAGTW